MATRNQLDVWEKNELEALAEYSDNLRQAAVRAVAALDRGDMAGFEDEVRWLTTAGLDFARVTVSVLENKAG